MTKKLFISYSHKDAAFLQQLVAHLRPLERAGLISPWFDEYLIPGDNIDEKVAIALKQADIVVLLVSSDFLNSDYCYTKEMEMAMNRHAAGEARVVPVMLRECIFDLAPFSRLVMLPTDAKPIMSLHWPDKDEAWRIVAQGIRSAASNGRTSRPTQNTVARAAESGTKQALVTNTAKPMGILREQPLTDKDRDDFRHVAFERLAERFEASIAALDKGFTGTFRRIDSNRFTAVIYLHGKKQAGFTVWTGGAHFGNNSICYHESDSGETNTMNGSLSVKINAGEKVLEESMNFFRSGDARSMNPDQAAEYLWSKFVQRIS